MVSVLSASELYEFTGGTPPTKTTLADRYRAQVSGSSLPHEKWNNWIVRLDG